MYDKGESYDIHIHKRNDKSGITGIVSVINDRAEIGGAFNKARIKGKFKKYDSDQKPTRELKLIVKNALLSVGNGVDSMIGTDIHKSSFSEIYLERWKFLKKNGIPTIDSMRILDDETIVMGDMTAGGGEFFGKAKARSLREELSRKITRKHTNMEKMFLNINEKDLIAEIDRIQKKAWELKIRLPADDQFDILVLPDGTYKVIVHDLACLKLVEDSDTQDTFERERGELRGGLYDVYKALGDINNMGLS